MAYFYHIQIENTVVTLSPSDSPFLYPRDRPAEKRRYILLIDHKQTLISQSCIILIVQVSSPYYLRGHVGEKFITRK